MMLKSGLAWRLATDIPNERSLHVLPTPRVGGLAIVPVAVVLMLVAAPALWPAAAGALFLALVSQIDDRRGLSARTRFAAHLAAIIGFLLIERGALAWLWFPVLAVAMAWLVNLYNFMDGADGLAGGMAVFGFGGYAAAALFGPHPEPQFGMAAAAVAGAALGFLVFNFSPARIFLGDAGSIPLGFLAGAFGYWGWRHDVWPIAFAPLVFAPFIADASVTLARRLLQGKKFWEAHREHYYQRMIRSGAGHRTTAILWYGVMLIGTMLAFFLLSLPLLSQCLLLGIWAVVLAALALAIDRRWRRSIAG
ncbi:MraY family glycosyltransferase [Paraburkholderia lycopersici]